MTSFRWTATCAAIALLAACVPTRRTPKPPIAPAAPTASFEPVSWSRLPGWRTDNALAAWPAILASCNAMRFRPEWQPFCTTAVASSPMDSDFVRGILEQHLQAYRVWRDTGGKREGKGLITGYYEPLLHGSREKTEQFATPLYSRPDDLLIIDLASLYPELKGKRVRGRVEG